MSVQKWSRFQILALAFTIAGNSIWSSPANADDTVTLTIVASGALQVGIAHGTMPIIAYSDKAAVEPSVLDLVVNDHRGTSAGWTVNIDSSNFTYLDESTSSQDIPQEGFRVSSAQSPRTIAGQPRVAGGPNFDSLFNASLDTPRTSIWTAPGSGSGDYLQIINVALDVPALTPVGSYESILTVTATSGP